MSLALMQFLLFIKTWSKVRFWLLIGPPMGPRSEQPLCTCVHSLNQCLLRLYLVSDSFLESGSMVTNKQTTVPVLIDLGPGAGKVP